MPLKLASSLALSSVPAQMLLSAILAHFKSLSEGVDGSAPREVIGNIYENPELLVA